jgi:MFS transporter, DHA1 family, multidrug resistance protein
MPSEDIPSAPPAAQPPRAVDPGLRFRGFVALMAGLMALNALGIDSMLAALPEIGRALHVADENRRQLIMVVYVFGFGAAQLVWGPLADAHGRRPIVIACTGSYAVLSVIAGLASSFELLLVARLLQGIGAAASRVLVVSIVRDCYSGRTMARVMSLSFIVFLAVPILAPTIGQLIFAATGSWRAIFFALGLFGAALTVICFAKLNETLHPEYRRPVSVASLSDGLRRVIFNRIAIGYTLASAATFGALLGFVNSVQQIFADIFDAARLFPLIFACVAASMGVAGFLNSRIVERLGSRRVSHAALLLFVTFSATHLLVAASGLETLVTFAVLQALTMFCFGLMGSNFGAMAMEPVGDIAGIASSVQGFLSTTLGAAIGYVIGQHFNGTTVPLAVGFTVMGCIAIGIVLFAERGRLFRPHQVRA